MPTARFSRATRRPGFAFANRDYVPAGRSRARERPLSNIGCGCVSVANVVHVAGLGWSEWPSVTPPRRGGAVLGASRPQQKVERDRASGRRTGRGARCPPHSRQDASGTPSHGPPSRAGLPWRAGVDGRHLCAAAPPTFGVDRRGRYDTLQKSSRVRLQFRVTDFSQNQQEDERHGRDEEF